MRARLRTTAARAAGAAGTAGAAALGLLAGGTLAACAEGAAGGAAGGAGGHAGAGTVVVYAAASTAPYVTAIAEAHERRTGVRVRASFAASSTLARQIEAGAPADVFVAAHPSWMDRLEAAGLIEPGSRRDLLGNALVLAVPRGAAPATVVDLAPGAAASFLDAWPGRVAVGDPDHVPVGAYARQALAALGWRDALAPRLLPVRDARAAVRMLEMGEAAAAIAYRSDVLGSEGAAVAARFDPALHDPIVYPAAVRRGAGPAAADFAAALSAPDAEALRASLGFTVPP